MKSYDVDDIAGHTTIPVVEEKVYTDLRLSVKCVTFVHIRISIRQFMNKQLLGISLGEYLLQLQRKDGKKSTSLDLTSQRLFRDMLTPETKTHFTKENSLEAQYVEALISTLANGYEVENDRTGTGTYYGGNVTFTVSGYMPLEEEREESSPWCSYTSNRLKLIGRAIQPLLAYKEMTWFINGFTDKESINRMGVHYWDKFFLMDGTIGKSYGHQFRHHNKVDQLVNVIEGLKNEPFGRRHIISLWNIDDLDEMALPSCFHTYQFNVRGHRTENNENTFQIDLTVNSRSGDAFLGVPYNFLSSYFLLSFVVNALNRVQDKTYKVGSITWNIANFHIYRNHVEQVIEYLNEVAKNYNALSKQVFGYLVDEGAHRVDEFVVRRDNTLNQVYETILPMNDERLKTMTTKEVVDYLAKSLYEDCFTPYGKYEKLFRGELYNSEIPFIQPKVIKAELSV